MQPVYVSGCGVVSTLGSDLEAWWQALCAGKSGQQTVSRFSVEGIERDQACEVPDEAWLPALSAQEQRDLGRASAYALVAARAALTQAGLPQVLGDPARHAVLLGTSMGEGEVLGSAQRAWFHGDAGVAASPGRLAPFGSITLPTTLARAWGSRGPVHTLPGACAAGNYAIGLGAALIRSGRVDRALVGASEVMERLQYAGFARLGAMAPERCQPFDAQRKGLVIGEGAGVMLLESEAALKARGAVPLAQVGVLGLTCDAFHITRPADEGAGSARALRRALEASCIAAGEVDWFCAHGTGTEANDAIEAQVIARSLDAGSTLVSSLKGALGHAMGAASAIEAVACVQALRHGVIPQTTHLETPDPALPIQVLSESRERPELGVVVNNALAFGGYNAALPFMAPERAAAEVA